MITPIEITTRIERNPFPHFNLLKAIYIIILLLTGLTLGLM